MLMIKKYLDLRGLVSMKKSDGILIFVIVIIGFLSLFFLNCGNNVNKAVVYYNDEIILKVELNKRKEYVVKGELGDLVIETDIGKIRVKEEVSPRHLCSLQGWVSNSYTPIICLPNKIVIKMDNSSLVDTVVR